MESRFISAVAFYGPKTGRLRELLTGVQALIAEHVGGDFRPYTLDQVHATLIALNGVRAGGTIVNEYLLEHAGEEREMDLPRVMDILARRFATPLRVRIGGFRPGQAIPFTSRGQHVAERSFSVQGEAFVLVGWPAEPPAGAGRPLDDLRREMNAAGVLHRYHARPGDVDNDLHLVVGHQDGAPAAALARATAAVRDKLAADPADLAIALSDVTIVAADSHTLAPPLYVSGVPLRRPRCSRWCRDRAGQSSFMTSVAAAGSRLASATRAAFSAFARPASALARPAFAASLPDAPGLHAEERADDRPDDGRHRPDHRGHIRGRAELRYGDADHHSQQGERRHDQPGSVPDPGHVDTRGRFLDGSLSRILGRNRNRSRSRSGQGRLSHGYAPALPAECSCLGRGSAGRS